MTIDFNVPGEPCGKGRPRFCKISGRIYTPDTTKRVEEKIASLYRLKYGGIMFPKHVPLSVKIVAFFRVNPSDSKRQQKRKIENMLLPTKKPDADNIAKIILDGLNGVAYHDDGQVVDVMVQKRYAMVPRVEISIRENAYAGGNCHERT